MRFQTLEEWLDWQSTLHPREIELGLARVSRVWRRLRPQGLTCRVISVAGTNGKGSSVALLESIYRQAGYRVGSYTSPHLVHYNERVRIDGRTAGDRALCEAFERIDQARAGTPLTYFEFGTLAALELFTAAGLDLALLEVGLGGRLDAVNIVDPDLALITTVDLDHMAWLGRDREQIGAEKAGILRAHRPAVLGQADIPWSVLARAGELAAPISLAGRDFDFQPGAADWRWLGPNGSLEGLPLPGLPGGIQLQNAAAVLMAVQLLQSRLPVGPAAIAQGLREARLAGRLHYLERQPPVILDVAHNAQAVAVLRDELLRGPICGRIHAIFTLLSDKDVEPIVRTMGPLLASWQLLGLEVRRGQSAEALAERLRAAGITGEIGCHASFPQALAAATRRCGVGDAILVFGSFLLVGEALAQGLGVTTPAGAQAPN